MEIWRQNINSGLRPCRENIGVIMISFEIKNELKKIFKDLKNKIILKYYSSDHEKQKEMEILVRELSEINSLIIYEKINKKRKIPTLKIFKEEEFSGVCFVGIPGGHEFSSLILAMLNAVGMGKFPDTKTILRIKNLKKVDIKTYVSLSCENCPEVVQSLNLIAILNKEITHSMINGELVSEEVEKLNIQGVPSVLNGENKHLFSGKNTLGEIVDKLESLVGKIKEEKNENLGLFDVVVLGGGPAGASSAIYTARKGLKTAIVAQKLGGQIKDTKGIENFISKRYIEGKELFSEIENHILDYNIEIFEHRVAISILNNNIKEINLSSGEKIFAKSIILATGAKWKNLNIEGERDYIGKGVAFCPHCDGPFYKEKNVLVVGGGNSGVEAALDLSGIASSVILLEFSDKLKADSVLLDKLKERKNVKIILNAKASQIIGDDTKVIGIDYEDLNTGDVNRLSVDGIFIQIGLAPNSNFVEGLVKLNKYKEIIVDEKCRTNIEGILAAGDVTTVPYKQIIISMGEGAKAGLSAFEYLSF